MRLIYTNELNERVEFGVSGYGFTETNEKPLNSRGHLALVDFEGMGGTSADVQAQRSPFQDGQHHVDTLLEANHPRIEFIMIAGNDETLAELRRRVSRVFNPKINGTIEYADDGEKHTLNVTPEAVPFYSLASADAVNMKQTVSVNLVAHNPYWKSETIEEEQAFEPMFRFPIPFFSDNEENGEVGKFIMGIQRDERIIFNDGDAPTPIKVIFYGPAQQPQIVNLTTGEFIKVKKHLQENERMEIDTTDGDKSVYFIDENGNRENVFHWIDLDSTFFDLQLGENHISCMCAVSNLSKDFEIYYQKLYVGV